MTFNEWSKTVNERNCNARLSALYKTREAVSNRIAKLCAQGCDITALEAEYAEIVDCINELCEFRKTHDCLIEGDPGFVIMS